MTSLLDGAQLQLLPRHLIRRPRYFDKVDILTGTPEADTFEVEPPGFATQSWQDDWMIRMGIPMIIDESTDSEVDILVYQEQERANYLEGFQAPTERSYTYIEDFDTAIDLLLVGSGRDFGIFSDENNIPMLTDDIQPANWLISCNEDGGDCIFL